MAESAKSVASADPEACWTVTPLTTPLVLWRCPRCDEERRFRSSDKFRVNAQKKRLDVWLVYNCTVCKSSRNVTVLSRVRPDEIPASDHQAYLSNDRDVAWRTAFDREILRQNKTSRFSIGDVRIQGPPFIDVVRRHVPPSASVRIQLRPTHAIPIRLETIVAHMTGVSRAHMADLFASGKISTEAKLTRPTLQACELSFSPEAVDQILRAGVNLAAECDPGAEL